VISLALYGVADANSSQNSDKVEWAQTSTSPFYHGWCCWVEFYR